MKLHQAVRAFWVWMGIRHKTPLPARRPPSLPGIPARSRSKPFKSDRQTFGPCRAPGTIHPSRGFIAKAFDLACSADTIRRAFNVDFATCVNVKQGAEVQLGPDNGGNDSEIAAISGKQLPFVATRSCGPRQHQISAD